MGDNWIYYIIEAAFKDLLRGFYNNKLFFFLLQSHEQSDKASFDDMRVFSSAVTAIELNKYCC